MATEVKFETNISEILEKAKELKATAEQTTYKNNIGELERMQDRMRDLFKNMTSPEMSQFTDGLVESFNEILAQTHGIGTSLNNMFDGLNLNQVEIAQAHFRELQQVIVSAMTTLKDGGKEGTSEYRELASALTHVNNALSNLKIVDTNISLEGMSRLTKGNTTRMQDFANSMRQVFGASKQMESGIKSSTRSFNIGGVSVKRFMSSLVGVQSAYSFLSRATRQYINSHSAMSSSLQGITVGFGELLAPAINYVIRGLQTLVRWVMIAIAYIQTFINVIFGTSFAIRYVIKDTSDLNKGLGGLGKSAKKGSKAVQKEMKKMLAPFDELNVISEDTDDNLGDMGSSGVGVGGGVGGGVAPDMSPFDISEYIEPLKKFHDWLEKNKKLIKSVTTVVLALVAAFVVLKVAMAFGDMMSILANPTMLAIAAIIVAVILIAVYWEDIVEFISDLWDGFVKWITDVWDGFVDWFKGVLKSMGDWWDNLVKALSDAWNATMEAIKQFFADIGQWISDKWNAFIQYWSDVIDNIVIAWDKGWTAIKEFFSGIGTWIGEKWKAFVTYWSDIIDGIRLKWTQAWDKIKQTFSNVREWVIVKVKALGDVFGGVWDGAKDSFEKAFNKIKEIFGSVWNWIVGQFSKGGKIFNNFKDGVLGVFKTIVNTLIRGINVVIGTPFRMLNNALNKFKNISILGKKPFGFIPNIPVPNIPQLATGNVATEPLHAIFGEYTGAKHNPEITTPQRTMERSFAKELDKREPSNEGGDLHIEVNVDGKRSITETVKDYNQYKRRGGKLSFGID